MPLRLDSIISLIVRVWTDLLPVGCGDFVFCGVRWLWMNEDEAIDGVIFERRVRGDINSKKW